MIKIENVNVVGFEPAIRGMRNPMNSWIKSDTIFCDNGDYHDICGNSGPINIPEDCSIIGPNDLNLMLRLARAGSVDGKFRRMIVVYVDITAPLYWWKEFDTYKVGTVANSCSTMHKIHTKAFSYADFSYEHLLGADDLDWGNICPMMVLDSIIEALNHFRKKFLETQDKSFWWQLIQLLPSSYNQKRTIMLNYEVLANIYQHRRNHKLDEWRELCHWIEGLPYSEIVTCNVEKEKNN